MRAMDTSGRTLGVKAAILFRAARYFQPGAAFFDLPFSLCYMLPSLFSGRGPSCSRPFSPLSSSPSRLPPGARRPSPGPIVQYDIQARLVPESKTIQGRETLIWRNDSDGPVAELRFHLYMNAFKNNRSTFMNESGGSSRGFRADKENWGYIDVPEIGIKDGADLTPTMEYVQPDDGNADDQTVMRVTLPAPVKPGESITLIIAFTVKLPKVFARAGFAGDFFMAGQWFPKIGVLWKGEWNCHQYHAQSEFFADFGTYKVEITVPEKYVVGATGKRIGEREERRTRPGPTPTSRTTSTISPGRPAPISSSRASASVWPNPPSIPR